jgi:hypothetical protein
MTFQGTPIAEVLLERQKSKKTLNMILVPEDQFKIVVLLVLFISAHMKVAALTPIDGTHALGSPVVSNSTRDLKPATIIQLRHPSATWPHLRQPIRIHLRYQCIRNRFSLTPLLFLQTRLATPLRRGSHQAKT